MRPVSFSARNNHYNPDEPRDEFGRWTTGGSSGKAMPTWSHSSQDWPLPNPSPVGRARTLLGHAIVGLYPEFTLPSDKEAKAFSQLLTAWNDANHLDDQTFHNLFVGNKLASRATTCLMREAAQGAKNAETIDQMIAASHPLTQAINAIGPDCWPQTLQCQAETVVKGRESQGNGNVVNNNQAQDEPNGYLDKIAKEVNPAHGDKNCADIVDAVIARLRGLDPDAVAKNSQGVDLQQVKRKYRITIQDPVSFDTIFNTIRNGGDGTIAIIVIATPDYKNGHVVVIANDKGRVGMVEGQDVGRGPAKEITSPREANERYNRDGSNIIGYGIVPP